MTGTANEKHFVIVVGAGPAGIFLAGELADAGVRVLILNRDIRPGGLVEYGIYPTKHALKGGVRRKMHEILDHKNVKYLGKAAVGDEGVLSLADLRDLGPSAIAVTTGAQGTKLLGLPGETRPGVYHAKDVVYHYTGLPPFSEYEFAIGGRCLIIGMGNVAIDIAHWLTRVRKVESVTIMARRGPAARKYTTKELEVIGANLDVDDLAAEFARIGPQLREVGQDPKALHEEVLAEFQKRPVEAESDTRVRVRYLCSPKSFEGLDDHPDSPLSAVIIGHNKLRLDGDRTRSVDLEETTREDYDTVIFAIGDLVAENIGLPLRAGHYSTNDEGEGDLCPHEIIDPDTGELIEGVFVAGWARRASEGLVGIAKRDGVTCAKELLKWLSEREPPRTPLKEIRRVLDQRLRESGTRTVNLADVKALLRYEERLATEQGETEIHLRTDEAMFAAIDSEGEWST